MRFGILGGSFNPPHLGHLMLASYAHAQLGLDAVLLVPAWSPPHKRIDDDVPADLRLQLARAAAAGDPRLEVSDIEIRLQLRFTIDSIRALRAAHPGADLWFLAGADSLAAFSTWKDPAEILRECRLAVAPRVGVTQAEAEAARRRLLPGDDERIVLLDMPVIGISSTMLRDRVRAGLPVRYAVPADVEAMIGRLGLYRNDLPRSPQEGARAETAGAAGPPDAAAAETAGTGSPGEAPLSIVAAERVMAARVSPGLYEHCRRVGRYAAELAARWQASSADAELAGILHDYWREADAGTILRRAEELGLTIGEIERQRPVQLLHARLAAAELGEMGVPEAVCAAIARHTVGGAGMTVLEKCLYVADAAEPGRSYQGVAELRELAHASLDQAVAWSNRRGLEHLMAKGRPIHPDSIALYNEGL